MAFHLQRGGSVPLPPAAAGRGLLAVGLGRRRGPALAVGALVVDEHGRALSDRSFVHAGRPEAPGGAVRLAGPDGSGFEIDLGLLPAGAAGVRFAAAVQDPPEPCRSLGDVHGSYILIRTRSGDGTAAEADGGADLARYELEENLPTRSSVVIAELYRRAEGWRFRALGQDCTTDLDGIALRHGIAVGT
ncbi:TerD family protein [Spirillospora sp. CA-253888]